MNIETYGVPIWVLNGKLAGQVVLHTCLSIENQPTSTFQLTWSHNLGVFGRMSHLSMTKPPSESWEGAI